MKEFRIVIKVTIVGAFLLISNFNVLAQEDLIVLGKVQYVYDGDTYLIKSADNEEIKVRLLHIDCPEKDQTYGKEATQYAESRILGASVKVYIKSYDQYGRALGLVMEENGSIFNFELIALGFAWHYSKYSDDLAASALMQFAKESRSGLWAHPNPEAPWNFRN